MEAGGAPERRPRRGPAPIASFDHDVSDESSPETKQNFRLPEIREDASPAAAPPPGGLALAPPEHRARSHSSPAVHGGEAGGEAGAAAGGLQTPAAPRIDISRASSSSHHDSRDSSPELALFSGGGEEGRVRLELGFREDGALELRSSTEELAFLEGAPGEPRAAPAPPATRRHSRKDSQSSEAALLAVSGRTSRLSSVGSQCSAHSALSAFSHTSRVSHLSVVSGASRSPSPHKMLLETSFCGPKPIETDPEICVAAVEERLLEIAKITADPLPMLVSPPPSVAMTTKVSVPDTFPTVSTASASIKDTKQNVIADHVDARDYREVRIKVTVENARPTTTPRLVSPAVPPATPCILLPSPESCSNILDEDKRLKETRNRARAEERRARSRERREPSQPEIYRSKNHSKDIIRIKLKPDHEYDDEDDESERTLVGGEPARKPVTLELSDRAAAGGPAPRRLAGSRTPSPSGAPVSRKSSFCSLFKSRETIASPDSPCDVLRRKKSLNEGRSRSKSRDRSTTPTSASKIKGSVLSLFKTPRKNVSSPSQSSRDGSPVVQMQRQFPQQHNEKSIRGEKLKYYENSKDGIIHIPLRTPSDDIPSPGAARPAGCGQTPSAQAALSSRDLVRPASAPQSRAPSEKAASGSSINTLRKLTKRTVLPDGSIIIPLHSPIENNVDNVLSSSEVPSTAETNHSGTATAERVAPGSGAASEQMFHSFEEVSKSPEKPAGSTLSEAARVLEEEHRKRRERIVFTTQVGSKEHVFSTQFSITKTPSVTSEISESIPSFSEGDGARAGLRDTHIAAESPPGPPPAPAPRGPAAGSPGRGSSGSEEEAEEATRRGSEVERRGLVVQESFEEELPYVPTTLPLERSLALPMVPVRERSGVRVAGVQRPRVARAPAEPAPPPPPRAPPAAAAAPAPPDKLHIKLPRRTRTASASAPPRPERARTRSGGDEFLLTTEMRKKAEWIDFEEVPERRKMPKRIQTLPATEPGTAEGAVPADEEEVGAGGLVYVEPELCRCECHARRDDELPLLPADEPPAHRADECVASARVQLDAQPARAARRRPAHAPRTDHVGEPQ